jgi:hypothetical protein
MRLAVLAALALGLSACSESEGLVDPGVPLVIQGVTVQSRSPFKLAVQLEGAPRAIEGSAMVKVSVTGKIAEDDEKPLAGDVTLTRGKKALPLAEAVASFTFVYKEKLPTACLLPGEDEWACTGQGVMVASVEITTFDGKTWTRMAEPASFDVELK